MLFSHNLLLASRTYPALATAILLQDSSATPALSAHSRLIRPKNPIIVEGIKVKHKAKGRKLVAREDFLTSGAFSNAQQMLVSVIFTLGNGHVWYSNEIRSLILKLFRLGKRQ